MWCWSVLLQPWWAGRGNDQSRRYRRAIVPIRRIWCILNFGPQLNRCWSHPPSGRRKKHWNPCFQAPKVQVRACCLCETAAAASLALPSWRVCCVLVSDDNRPFPRALFCPIPTLQSLADPRRNRASAHLLRPFGVPCTTLITLDLCRYVIMAPQSGTFVNSLGKSMNLPPSQSSA